MMLGKRGEGVLTFTPYCNCTSSGYYQYCTNWEGVGGVHEKLKNT